MASDPPVDGWADRSTEGISMTATTLATGVEHVHLQVVDQYIASWNETNPQARRELIARTWTEDGSYLDPLMSGEGHDGIDAMIGGAQSRYPGFRFRRTGELDAHNDRVRFSWELGLEGEPPLAGGVDFGVISGGRLQSITGFLDLVPGGDGE
jgi:SnoaL-like domain